MWVCGRGTHSFASSATNLKVSGKMDGCMGCGWACRALGTDLGDKYIGEVQYGRRGGRVVRDRGACLQINDSLTH